MSEKSESIALCVGHLPERKLPYLFVHDLVAGEIRALAQFRSVAAMDEFILLVKNYSLKWDEGSGTNPVQPESEAVMEDSAE